MSSSDPEHNLTPAEIEELGRLKALAQRGLGTYLHVGNALAEIRGRQLYRGSHASFETYLRKRWGVNVPNGDPISQTLRGDTPETLATEPEPRAPVGVKPCEALARACEQTLSALDGADRLGIEIRLAIREQGDPSTLPNGQSLDRSQNAGSVGDELLPTLRWLLNQASGTIGAVGHELESRAADIDEGARAQLRDDVLFLDAELAVIKALLTEVTDWDSELRRLLQDELPPLDPDTDPEGDE